MKLFTLATTTAGLVLVCAIVVSAGYSYSDYSGQGEIENRYDGASSGSRHGSCGRYGCGNGISRGHRSAGGYGSGHSRYNNGLSSYRNNKNHLNNGYGNNDAGRYSPYGPYHSYAVRPAIYGGHGFYSYRGYARHAPAPTAHYRAINTCHGYNCGAPKLHYGLRPVKALVLSPANHYGGARPSYYGGRSNHGRNNQGHSNYNSHHGSGY